MQAFDSKESDAFFKIKLRMILNFIDKSAFLCYTNTSKKRA